jgi:exopolyphosphatase/guanosine-5'-triphosphate,3'-diphosphate pyrophosphatase
MIKSSIDLGTNTCLLLVADWDEKSQKVTRVIHDQSTMVRLGQGVDKTQKLHPDAIERTRACLRGYASRLIQLGVKPSQTIAVATATARDAQNGKDFFSEIEKDFGFRFQIITGEEEARYMFLGGMLPDSDPDHSVVIDIGGGSTELKTLHSGVSLKMGSVRFTERFLKSDPVTDEEFWACQAAIDDLYASIDEKPFQGKSLLGVAGTIVTLAQWQLELLSFDAEKLNGSTLTRGDVHRLVEELKWRSIAERRLLPGMEPGRADVILAGALILWRAMELFNLRELKISTRGLRYGVLSLKAD